VHCAGALAVCAGLINDYPDIPDYKGACSGAARITVFDEPMEAIDSNSARSRLNLLNGTTFEDLRKDRRCRNGRKASSLLESSMIGHYSGR
jgi:hypothetical protein